MWFDCGYGIVVMLTGGKRTMTKLSVQQNPIPSTSSSVTPKIPINGFIHGICARPTSFDWKLRCRSFAPSLVQFCRVTAVNGKTYKSMKTYKSLLKDFRLDLFRLAARGARARIQD